MSQTQQKVALYVLKAIIQRLKDEQSQTSLLPVFLSIGENEASVITDGYMGNEIAYFSTLDELLEYLFPEWI